MKIKFVRFLIGIFAFVICEISNADEIKFPDEELATESVLPVFDQKIAVKNQAVQMKERFEFGPIAGMNLLEPFFSPITYGINMTYNFNEDQGLQFFGVMFHQEFSNYSKQIDSEPSTKVNFSVSPRPKYMGLFNYQWSPFYGKMSMTKDWVMNLKMFGLLGAGFINISETMKPVVDVGMGQSFFISPNFSLRFDLMVYIYRGPPPISDGTAQNTATSTYSDTIMTGSIIGLSTIFILPSM